MACGDRHAALLSVNGWGPTNPTGWKPWASVTDVEAWTAVADHIFDLVRTRWNALVDAETTKGDYTQSRSIRDYVTSYEQGFAALPKAKWWEVAGANQALAQVVLNAEVGVCALELVEDALAAAGSTDILPVPNNPEPEPFISPEVASSGMLIGVVVLAIGAALFLDQREDRKQARPR